jgi:alpha-glucosidase
VLRRGRARDAFVKEPGGRRDVVGEVWPGRSRFPDFLGRSVREWWGDEQQALLDLGVAGIWNDMNEPANFARPDKTLPPRAVHRTDFGRRRHAEVHNVYGMQMARASRDGALRHRPNERPFVITRAGYAGIQHHALVWTGDNSSCWEHLSDALRQCLNLGLTGVAFVGADVGGFLDSCTPELFVRWLQFAAFTPFLRNHSCLGTRAQEPWAFGPEIEEIARHTLGLRYQLLPYLYGLFERAARDGTPIMRPLLWHYPNDPLAAVCDDQFLLGEHLLVAPILRPGAGARSVYLPRGEWFDFWTGAKAPGGVHLTTLAPLERIPLFVRAGTILPLTPTRLHVGPREPETVVLHVWPDDDGCLDWYDDDGRTLDHTRGAFQRRRIESRRSPRGGSLRIGAAQGDYPGNTRAWRVILRHTHRPVRVRVDGAEIPSEHVPELELAAFDLPARSGAVEARWR